MGWRDELVSASFRDVPFKVKSSSTEVGRRSVVHEVPFSDIPYPEDFGKASGVYNITGYIIQTPSNGFNYIPERNALIDALSKKGTGTLTHPFYGGLQVVLSGRARFEETFDEGGIAKFTAVFIEAGSIQIPLTVLNPKSAVEQSADNLISAAGNYFTSVFNTTGPNFLSGTIGALGDFQKGLQMVQSTLYRVQATAVAKVSEALSTVASVRTSAAAIINAPANIVSAMENTFAVYRDLIPFFSSSSQGESGVDSALGLTGYGATNEESVSYYGGQLDPIPTGTETRTQQINNRNAMIAYFRVGGFAESIAAAGNIEYESYDQAHLVMEQLVEANDNLLSYLAEAKLDVLYDTVMASKPAFVSALLELGAALPPIRQYPILDIIPTLVISQLLYNDLSREQEIIDRNKIKVLHPGFPDGGTELAVLGE